MGGGVLHWRSGGYHMYYSRESGLHVLSHELCRGRPNKKDALWNSGSADFRMDGTRDIKAGVQGLVHPRPPTTMAPASRRCPSPPAQHIAFCDSEATEAAMHRSALAQRLADV